MPHRLTLSVYNCHPSLISCFHMDSSHNKLYDNITSMWGPNVDKASWPPPPPGQDAAIHAAIMESRTRGGGDQSCA